MKKKISLILVLTMAISTCFCQCFVGVHKDEIKPILIKRGHVDIEYKYSNIWDKYYLESFDSSGTPYTIVLDNKAFCIMQTITVSIVEAESYIGELNTNFTKLGTGQWIDYKNPFGTVFYKMELTEKYCTITMCEKYIK